MARIVNTQTILDIEYVINAPSPGSDQTAWIAHGVECARDRNRFSGKSYSFSFEVLSLRFYGRLPPSSEVPSIRLLAGSQGAKLCCRSLPCPSFSRSAERSSSLSPSGVALVDKHIEWAMRPPGIVPTKVSQADGKRPTAPEEAERIGYWVL
jgi:hypothetical protein